MARAPVPSRMLRSGTGYLEERYPGISGDIIGYRHDRSPAGEETLTIKLVVHDQQPAGDEPS